MKFLITAIFFLFTLTADAQLAILNSKNAFVNVHEKASLNSKVVGKINKNDVLAISPFDEGLQGFTKVWYHYKPKKVNNFVLADDVKEGFIPSNVVLFLEDLKQIYPLKQTNNKVNFKNKVYEITIETKPFDEKHLVVEKSNGQFTIDGKIPWAYTKKNDLRELKSIEIKMGKQVYSIRKEAIQNLYQPNLDLTKVYVKSATEIYINMSNADGSDSYEAIWQIVNGKLKKLTVMQVIP